MNSPQRRPLRVAIFVRRFAPDIGGIEMTAQVLARGFTERHEARVTVVTRTVSPADEHFPFEVVREPGPAGLLRIARESDVILHNNPLMRFAWAGWVTDTPTVIAIRQYVSIPGARVRPSRRVLLHAKYMAIEDADELVGNSEAMAAHIPRVSSVVPNSYRDSVFRVDNAQPRPRQSLAFLGRLSWDKGPDMPIRAVAALVERGFDPNLTVMGPGTEDERSALERLADELGVSSRVTFVGAVDGVRANAILNDHAIAVVPSLQPESFGTVALEEAAAGCVVVGSGEGGLVQAIGPCGPLFQPRNLDSLVAELERLFMDDAYFASFRDAAPAHLAQHTENTMVDRYYEIVQRVAAGGGRNPDARTMRGRMKRLRSHGPSEGIG